MKHAKVAIIGGAGNVGSTIAYALMMQNIVSEIILVDVDQERLLGQVLDLSDSLSFSRTSHIYSGSFSQAAQADIIIIAAGKGQLPGQKRSELLQENARVIKAIFKSLGPISSSSIVIMVSNPVDVMTMLAQDYAGLPRKQVFGSGTFLDTQRLRRCIGLALGVGLQSIHVYVLGEHGDDQFVFWSSATIAGISLAHFKSPTASECQVMAKQAREEVYSIIESKGATFFGVGACVSAYCENILFDQKRVLPLSCYQSEFGVCMSMPVVLGECGVEQIFEISLDDAERKACDKAVVKIRSSYELVSDN
ncbi:MAG TPA: L-lactate dehydrogenase [Candidatus Babeliales bacterium]|nr:L-lactate dehydrogenase [Candidatus Babeliales bacterium]